MARSEETRQAWLDALAEMEAVAGNAGDAQYEVPAWSPAADLGPLPLDLVDRALDVQKAQKSALGRVLEARRRVVKHISALKSVPPTRDADRAVYLDATG